MFDLSKLVIYSYDYLIVQEISNKNYNSKIL